MNTGRPDLCAAPGCVGLTMCHMVVNNASGMPLWVPMDHLLGPLCSRLFTYSCKARGEVCFLSFTPLR